MELLCAWQLTEAFALIAMSRSQEGVRREAGTLCGIRSMLGASLYQRVMRTVDNRVEGAGAIAAPAVPHFAVYPRLSVIGTGCMVPEL